MPVPRSHALDHHPSFRAVIAAAPPLADLARAISDDDLVRGLAVVCGELSVTYAVLFITVVAMLGPGVPSSFPGTPESVREYVWPGRTSVTVH